MVAAIASSKGTPAVWVIYTDGLYGNFGSSIGCLIIKPFGKIIKKAFRLGFKASIKEAEYEATIYALKIAKALGAEHILLLTDSKY